MLVSDLLIGNIIRTSKSRNFGKVREVVKRDDVYDAYQYENAEAYAIRYTPVTFSGEEKGSDKWTTMIIQHG